MTPTRTTAVAAAAVALALVATACTGPGPAPVPGPSTSTEATEPGPPVITESVLEPVTVGERAWGTAEAGVGRLDHIAFLGSIAIVSGRAAGEGSDMTISAVEAATGQRLWSRSGIAPLPGTPGSLWSTQFTAIDDGRAGLVIVEYKVETSAIRGYDHAIAALSAADGSVLWTRTVVTGAESTADGDGTEAIEPVLMAGNGVVDATGAVLVVVGPVDAVYGAETADPGTLRTIAFDPLTGEERWSAPDVVGRWVVGDAVVATKRAGVGFGLTGGPLVLDVDTGAQRWRSDDGYDRVMTSPPSAELVMVDFAEGPDRHVLSLDDGAVVAETHTVLSATADPTTDFVAWLPYEMYEEPGRTLVTFAPGDEVPSLAGSAPSLDDVSLQLSANGCVWVLRTDRETRVETTFALDRSGAELSAPVPGRPFAATDDRLVTVGRTGEPASSYDTFSVHPITR